MTTFVGLTNSGKSLTHRAVYTVCGADLILDRWLERRGGEPEARSLLSVRKDGEVQHADPYGEKKASLSNQAVHEMVKRGHREANHKEVSPYNFGKMFVGDLLDAVGHLSVAQRLAGHSEPASTVRCDRRG